MMSEDASFREITVISRVLRVFVRDESSYKSLYVSGIDNTEKTFICSIPAGISDEHITAILTLVGIQRRHAFSAGYCAAQRDVQIALGIVDGSNESAEYSETNLFLSTLVSSNS